jgi:hypothetical protein
MARPARRLADHHKAGQIVTTEDYNQEILILLETTRAATGICTAPKRNQILKSQPAEKPKAPTHETTIKH